MKMFKRFAAALLAGVMVLAMLTACGGGAGGPGESEFEKKVQLFLTKKYKISIMKLIYGKRISFIVKNICSQPDKQ